MRNSKKYFGKILFGLIAIGLALTGCQSMRKDPQLSSAAEKAYRDLAELEETVTRLDGAGASRQELERGRQQVAALEETVADPDFQACLSAWSGRLYLMEGKTSDAQREYQKSQSLSPLNLPSQVLNIRLERDLPKRLSMIDSGLETENSRKPSTGELLIERGRVLFDLRRFSESVAAYDSAFEILKNKPYYEEAHRVFRNKAWELNDLQQGTAKTITDIINQGEITWKDLIEITKSETELLGFITAGRDWPTETLFTRLLDRSFIPLTQDTGKTEWPFTKPSSAETVLRSGAAWFLWHLNAQNKANRGLLTQYSSRFANTPNARSPIPDIDINSPFLDSVLGCVESEFMSLPDSRNFMPRQRVKGSEYLSMLKKL